MSWLRRIIQSNQDLEDRMKDVQAANALYALTKDKPR
jgi:hypothetical protein